MNFATLEDITELYRALTPEEAVRAEALIPVVCDRLRQLALNNKRDLDAMIGESPVLADVAKSVTVDIVARVLMTPTEGAPQTQYAQSALGYSVSGTFLNAGGGVFIKTSELKALGITRPRYGLIDPWNEGRPRRCCCDEHD